MANLQGFNAAEVEPNQGFGLIPAGEYEACIVNSELKPTAKGDGHYINLEVQILNGQYQNRRVFHKLNLDNPSEKAMNIAKGTLSAICRAVGVLTPSDSSELHNKPLRIVVKIEKRKDTGEMKNEIDSFKPRNAQPVSSNALVASGASMVTTQKAPWR